MDTQATTPSDFGLLEHGQVVQRNLDRIAVLTKAAFGADGVGVTVLRGDLKQTTAHTDDWVLVLDEAQYKANSGPCLDAIHAAHTISTPSLKNTDRWPEFRAAAADLGVGSVLSLPLDLDGSAIGGLNIYWKREVALDDSDIPRQEAFAANASIALHNAALYEQARATVEQLETAMTSRAAIEQAKGILIAREHVDADEAFKLLVRLSQTRNRKLRDVAVELVDMAARGQHSSEIAST